MTTSDGPAETSFTLHYTVTEADLMAAQLHMAASAPTLRRQATIYRWVGPLVVLVAVYVLLSMSDAAPLSALAWALGGALIMWLVLPWVMRASLRRQLQAFARREGLGTLGQHSLTVSDAALTEQSPLGSHTVPWTAISEVHRTPQHVFLQLSPVTGAAVVPTRGIEVGAERLYQFAVARRQVAR